jgi:hypothetical protein
VEELNRRCDVHGVCICKQTICTNDELNKEGGIFVRLKKARQTAIFVLFCWNWAAGADTYAIDPAHSMVGFSVRHLVISHVSGYFQEFSGTIVYDEKDPSKSSVNVHIKAASIDTRNHDRDEHLIYRKIKNPFSLAKQESLAKHMILGRVSMAIHCNGGVSCSQEKGERGLLDSSRSYALFPSKKSLGMCSGNKIETKNLRD